LTDSSTRHVVHSRQRFRRLQQQRCLIVNLTSSTQPSLPQVILNRTALRISIPTTPYCRMIMTLQLQYLLCQFHFCRLFHKICKTAIKRNRFHMTSQTSAGTCCRRQCETGGLFRFALRHSACLLDISFVVDHSGSIRDTNVGSEDNWQHVIDFIVRVVSSINIGTTGTHVGAVSFGMYM